jgi:hypothetical protein
VVKLATSSLFYYISEEGLQSTIKKNVRFLKASYIQNIVKIRDAPEGISCTLPALDRDLIAARELAAQEKIEALMAKIGVGVSAYAQEIFDQLSKTFVCINI